MDSRATRLVVVASFVVLLGMAQRESMVADAKTFLHCGENGNSRPDGRYRANVRTVIQRMGKFTIRRPDLAFTTRETNPSVYAMAFCSTEDKPRCAACLRAALRDIKKCGNRFGATATRVGCKVRYDYFRFF